MDNNTTAQNAATTPAPSGSTPFPASDSSKPASNPPAATGANATPSDDTQANGPVLDKLIKRVTKSAHDAVDGVAAKVTSVADGLQGGVDKAGDTRDEWIESARDAIRQHPFAAVAGAVLVGAALLSLRARD